MKKIISCLMICFFSYFCIAADTGKYPFSKISKEEVYYFLTYSNNIQPMTALNIGQKFYSVPTITWIKEVYTPFFKEFLFKNNASIPVDPDNNCVKFASYAQTAGYLIHLKGEGPKNTTIAIGTVDFMKSLTVWHSLNVFVATDSNGRLQVVYFEPQNQSIVTDVNEWIMVRF